VVSHRGSRAGREDSAGQRRLAIVALWGVLGLAVVATIAVALLLSPASRRDDEAGHELPIYGLVPEFALVERSGRPLTAADLDGEIWVANFIFTQCAGMCPGLSIRMAALQRALGAARGADGSAGRFADVRLVSFSVDPTRDTPEMLRRYAERFGADPERWLFVTGTREAIHRLVRDGFRLSIAELPPGATGYTAEEPITHSDRFVLVDGRRRIRAIVHGTDEGAVPELMRGIAQLVRPGD
jgi:cytochrome oxidase Cu insertion factor (SCO1/SenC/PrrC family)